MKRKQVPTTSVEVYPLAYGHYFCRRIRWTGVAKLRYLKKMLVDYLSRLNKAAQSAISNDLGIIPKDDLEARHLNFDQPRMAVLL